jgi:hypothetical protein
MYLLSALQSRYIALEHCGPSILRSWPRGWARWHPCVNEFALRAALDPYELTVCPDCSAIIKGTPTPAAPQVYARYVGI